MLLRKAGFAQTISSKQQKKGLTVDPYVLSFSRLERRTQLLILCMSREVCLQLSAVSANITEAISG
jgi:hypothetical protein